MATEIKCECGETIDTGDNPVQVSCTRCGRRYYRTAPKLKLLGVEEVRFPGVVID